MANEAEQRCLTATPVGSVELVAADGKVIRVRFVTAEQQAPSPATPPTGVLRQASRELEEYFRGERREFGVPVRLPRQATPFQQRVWDAMRRIPCGETRTYGELAQELATAPRAVGGACARNPLPFFVPCHRVVAKHGTGGYGGDWETGLALTVKQWLLQHETG